MIQEHRRSTRSNVNMAVTLTLRDSKSGLALADPVQGIMLDISRHGTRLSLPYIRAGSYHLFYASSDDPVKVIHLEMIEGEEGGKLIIPAHPVWFNHVFSGPAKHFDLGLKFLVPPEDSNVIRRLRGKNLLISLIQQLKK